MRWMLTASNHVIPIDDLREHAEAPSCWCCPTEDDECPHVLVHYSMDGREAFETGARLPS
jgi:hypothetical protein